MTSTDSIHEMEAAKKRLAAAKTQASAAAANLISVKEMVAKMLDSAQALCDTANGEVKEAEKFLAETEKRLEVIDIDQEPNSPPKEGNKKRKAVSLSPQPNSNNNNNSSTSTINGTRTTGTGSSNGTNRTAGNSTNSTRAVSTSNNGPGIANASFNSSSSSNENTTSAVGQSSHSSAIPNVDQIIVEECGNEEVNGIYIRVLNDGSPAYTPTYTKRGVWKGQAVTFAIYRDSSDNQRKANWYIGRSQTVDGDYTARNMTLFKCEETSYSVKTIPEGWGWTIAGRTHGGIRPAPKCRVLNSSPNDVEEITVEGCGIAEVNGVYKRKGPKNDRAPVYTKRGVWKGHQGTFEISNGLHYGSRWYISFDGGIGTDGFYIDGYFYEAFNNEDPWIPPVDGWQMSSYMDGVQPVPKMKWSKVNKSTEKLI